MKHLLSFTLFTFSILAAFSGHLYAQPVEGDWEFFVQQAPWEYNKGVIQIHKNSDDLLEGTIIFHTGSRIPVENITAEDSEVTFRVFVDGTEVNADCTLEDGRLEGKVQTTEGEMHFTASRKEAESD